MIGRNNTIDFLRALAVVLMIFIHVSAFRLNNEGVKFLWDYTHIVVPLFVFCSGYVFFKNKNKNKLTISYLKKRILRLIVPYYTYLVILFLFLWNRTGVLSFSKMVNKFLLIGDRDLDWLVVLFLSFIIILPIIKNVFNNPKSHKIAAVLAIIIPSIFLFYIPDVPMRVAMSIPWTSFLTFTFLLSKYEDKRWFTIITLGSALVLFFLSRQYLISINHSLVFTENKYPPNIYYLSYGLFWTTVLYYLYSFLQQKELIATWLQKVIIFFSLNSYYLFFIHFLYVIMLKDIALIKSLSVWSFLGVVLSFTIATQLSFNYLRSTLKRGPII